MKISLRIPVLIAALTVAGLLAGCQINQYDVYTPDYLSYENLRTKVVAVDPDADEAPQMSRTGKIYVKDQYVYVNELYEGIHVIDNSDQTNPVVMAFIPIPGNVDMAILGTILYADSYVDLVAIDITDPTAAQEIHRVEDAFPYDAWWGMWDDRDWEDEYETPDEEEGIVVGWSYEETRTSVLTPQKDYAALEGGGGDSSGTGGSMARFTIVGDYLYALHSSYIQLVDLRTPEEPALWSTVSVGWDIETIFPYTTADEQNLLFIGAMSGMYVYDNSDPQNPEKISEFEHATSCDPVVVQGDYAYVTLRAGNLCGGGDNQLDIIDISDLANPTLIKSYSMQGPYGLGVDGDLLFVCDGVAGLKVFDVSDPLSIVDLDHVSGIETYDVILIPPTALVVGPDGFSQYDYTDPANIVLLSHIEVVTLDERSTIR